MKIQALWVSIFATILGTGAGSGPSAMAGPAPAASALPAPFSAATVNPRVLRVVYFTPSDREPYTNHVERVDRMMRDIQRFYAEGMAQRGFPGRGFRLEQDSKNRVLLHEVRGREKADYYTFDRGEGLRDEVKHALSAKGINIDAEIVVIFMAVMNRTTFPDGTVVVDGDCPYYGRGSFDGGTGWFNDDPRLDPLQFTNTTDRIIYKGSPYSGGKYATVMIGGIAHELGHALALPHIKETSADRKAGRGTSLMSSGNYTYREELRKEGAGSFLSSAEATMLAWHPLFRIEPQRPPRMPQERMVRLQFHCEEKQLIAEGQIVTDTPMVAMVAINDPGGGADSSDDYDAEGWVGQVKPDGTFRVAIGDLHPGKFELRLTPCFENGAHTALEFPYEVDQRGRPNIDDLNTLYSLQGAFQALAAGRYEEVRQLAALAEKDTSISPETRRRLAHLANLLNPIKPLDPAQPSAEMRQMPLSHAQWTEARTGWGPPLRDRTLDPQSPLLMNGGKFSSSGLYAHAPARHDFTLNGQWKKITTRFGLQDGKTGSVQFVILGDGRELFRSEVLKKSQSGQAEIDLTGVRVLTLQVLDGDDGNGSDWGLWLDPTLSR